MVTRVGGLASGMDIDAIVEKLMSAEKAPLNKLYQQQQTFEWSRDAYRDINTKLNTFDTYLFDNFRLSSNFYKKTVSSTNESLVKATATSSAAGSLSIEGVTQLATAWQGVGRQVNATSTTKMSELGLGAEATLSIKAIQKDGVLPSIATDIKINATDTVADAVKRINSSGAGVTAIFENGKLSVTANNTGTSVDGKSVDFTDSGDVLGKLGFNVNDYDADASNGQITQAKNAVFQVNGIATERTSNTFTLNGYNVTLSSTFNTNDTVQNYKDASQLNLDNAVKNLKDNYGIIVDTNDDGIIDETENTNANSELTTQLTTAQSALDSAKTALTADKNEVLLPSTLKTTYDGLNAETKTFLSSLNDDQIKNLKLNNWDSATVDTSLFTPDEITEIDQLNTSYPGDITNLNSLSEAELLQLKSPKKAGDVYSSLSSNTKAFLKDIASNPTLQQELATLDLENLSDTVPGGSAFSPEQWTELKALKVEDRKALNNLSESELQLLDNVRVEEENVTTKTNELNSIKNTSTQYIDAYQTNEDAKAMTGVVGETSVAPVTLTSSTDTDSMVTKIKEFVETYNGLITNINSKLREAKYRDYQPLTDEQKEDMSEDEIEKWEEKAKSGLLRSDSILTSGLYGLRNTFLNSVEGLGDSTIDSLAEIGITTSKTTSDGGKLVINEDKLRAAIEKNSDQVAQIFTKTGEVTKDALTGKKVDSRGIAQRLRDELDKVTLNIEKKSGKSSSTNQTFTLGKRLDEVEDRIDRWKDKLQDIESRYWRQFTAMETAINKSNQQSSLFMQQ